jgi:hypothetical protein
VKDFVKELLDLAPTAQGTIFAALKDRYGSGLLKNKLEPEMHWLKSLATEIEAHASKLPPLSSFRLRQRMAQNIAPFLKRERKSLAFIRRRILTNWTIGTFVTSVARAVSA